MKTLSKERYLLLRDQAEVIERDGHGDKVLRLLDGRYMKLFRRKRLVSSALWYPYAQRFVDNCQALQRLGIPCPVVDEAGRISDLERDIVIYQPLAGDTLRNMLAHGGGTPALGERLHRFVDSLHELGVYFRSLHLGNVVQTPEGRLGLIDVADMKVHGRSLSKRLRDRNLQHMVRYAVDRDWLRAQGFVIKV